MGFLCTNTQKVVKELYFWSLELWKIVTLRGQTRISQDRQVLLVDYSQLWKDGGFSGMTLALVHVFTGEYQGKMLCKKENGYYFFFTFR